MRIRNGRKLVKVNFVHGATGSILGDDSMCVSRIANKNRISLSGVNDIVNDCKTLGLAFRELDSKVLDIVCDLLES